MQIIHVGERPVGSSAYRFGGYTAGANVSFFLTQTPVGRGAKLH